MALESINPATGELLETFEEWSVARTRETIAEVHLAWLAWRQSSFAKRAQKMRKAAEVLRRKSEEYARIMALEMGKPIADGRGEVEKCAWVCDYYAENAERFLTDEPAQSDGSKAYAAFRPIGTVLAVMPWNFPFWQVFRFAAPALMAGNTGVLKHSSNVPRSALAIEEVFVEAGFPANVFRTLMIGSRQVEAVIENDLIKAVTLTGSDIAGRQVAAKAGQMLKKTVMELGGSDPFVVLADADLEQSAQIAAKARCINSGQSCIAAKRFIVEAPVYDAWLAKFTTAMQALVVGDPLDEKTQVGPQAREDLMLELHAQVETSRRQGGQSRAWRPADDATGILLSADHSHRGRAGNACLRRGILRPRGLGHPGAKRRRSRCGRQRYPFRARRFGMDRGFGEGGGDRRPYRSRGGFRQRHCQKRSAAAFRRRENFRLRA